jgi:hypothetical protein
VDIERVDVGKFWGPPPSMPKEGFRIPAAAAPEARSLILMRPVQREGDHGGMVEGESWGFCGSGRGLLMGAGDLRSQALC